VFIALPIPLKTVRPQRIKGYAFIFVGNTFTWFLILELIMVKDMRWYDLLRFNKNSQIVTGYNHTNSIFCGIMCLEGFVKNLLYCDSQDEFYFEAIDIVWDICQLFLFKLMMIYWLVKVLDLVIRMLTRHPCDMNFTYHIYSAFLFHFWK
jgi:hypothetical protein